MQLNVIRLLAKMTVAVNKSEIVDMILPLFIESLEEGDASTPGLLRLQVWELLSCNIICDVDVSHYIVTSLFFLPSVDGFLLLSYFFLLQLLDAVSRMASLGFEKSYRETIVLMTRSYLSKLSIIGSSESRTVAPEATTERVEVCISLNNVM